MAARLVAAREATLASFGRLTDEELQAWPHPGFSPLAWHLGHLAFTEATWTLGRNDAAHPLVGPYRERYAQDGRPKHARSAGYDREELFGYLARVREAVLEGWSAIDAGAPAMSPPERGWFLASHEHQHRETMAMVLRLIRLAAEEKGGDAEGDVAPGRRAREEAALDDAPPARRALVGGEVVLGTDAREAYDNERPATPARVGPFALDARPVSCAAWTRFIAADGYQRPELWDDAGWRWRERSATFAPQGWKLVDSVWTRMDLDGRRPLPAEAPVDHISWWEARAFARAAWGRLPTEPEWEFGADRGLAPSVSKPATSPDLDLRRGGPAPACDDQLFGGVWEWTASPFGPRPGFSPFPYAGYSQPYFDGAHRVLKGGSFATHPSLARRAFRNWYTPDVRSIFAGVRVAYDR